jgi:hypothetical protein
MEIHMITLEEAYSIIENLNEDAHTDSWDTWAEADRLEDEGDEDEEVTAEDMREQASQEQAGYFRNYFNNLDPEDKAAVEHWLKNDDSFKEEFSSWYGYDEFEETFDDI